MSDWNDWRYVLALARFGKATKAAEELGVDATTVLRRVKRLEEALDRRIFDRRGTSYQPTDYGAQMVRVAAKVEGEIRPFEDRGGIALPLAGSLRVMTSEDLAVGVLGPYFDKFYREYPGIQLDLIIDGQNLGLSHYEADVAVQTVPPRNHQYEAGEPISTVAWSYYSYRRYIDPELWPQHPKDLRNQCVISPLDKPLVRRWLEDVSPPIRPILRSTSLILLRQCALDDLGMAILPCYLGDAEPGLMRLFEPVEELAEELWIVSHDEMRNTALVRAFLDCVGKLTVDERKLIQGLKPSAMAMAGLLTTPA